MTELPYIDIHCHILPGVDDGSDSTETSIALLRGELHAGARGVILTPHFQCGRNRFCAAELRERYEALCEAAADAGVRIPLYLGNEILWYDGAERR